MEITLKSGKKKILKNYREPWVTPLYQNGFAKGYHIKTGKVRFFKL